MFLDYPMPPKMTPKDTTTLINNTHTVEEIDLYTDDLIFNNTITYDPATVPTI